MKVKDKKREGSRTFADALLRLAGERLARWPWIWRYQSKWECNRHTRWGNAMRTPHSTRVPPPTPVTTALFTVQCIFWPRPSSVNFDFSNKPADESAKLTVPPASFPVCSVSRPTLSLPHIFVYATTRSWSMSSRQRCSDALWYQPFFP